MTTPCGCKTTFTYSGGLLSTLTAPGGRVTAIGPVMTYTFECGKVPVTTQLEWMHEFDVENRAEGDMGLISISMPLSIGR